jgi:serine/threonine-protein kinase
VGERYRIVRRIGQGGMGQVFEASHVRLGTTVGLKTIHTDFAQNRSVRRGFYREARFGASMRHPRLVGIVDYGDDPEFGPYLVMELEEGRMLDSVLHSRGSLPASEAVDLCAQLLEALDFVHSEELVHGDIKPSNLMLSVDPLSKTGAPKLKLLDFGLSRSGALRHDGKVSGTPEYLAPEVVCGQPLSVASDIYATGILLYELLTGRPPFRGELPEVLSAHVHSEIPRPSTVCDVPEDVEEVLMRALRRAPESRQQSSAILREELLETQRKQDKSANNREVHLRRTAFEETCIARAVLTRDGEIVAANRMMGHLTNNFGQSLKGLSLGTTRWLESWPTLAEDLHRAKNGELITRTLSLSLRGAPVELLILLESSGSQGYLQLSAIPTGTLRG